jgi:hypothetical protein
VLKTSAPAPASGFRDANGDTGSVWLWLADVGPAVRPDWVERHTPWLSASELAHLERIARPERRAQLLAGHVLLRHLVAACTGGDARRVQVGTLADGRPQVNVPAGWQTSLAHSKQWVAALVAGGVPAAGVDIEWMDPRRQIQAIVEAACAVDAGSRERAYLLWTQREAEIKAGPGACATHVAAWEDRAIAVCAAAPPQATLVVDLDRYLAPRPLELTWATRPRLPAPAPAASRETG